MTTTTTLVLPDVQYPYHSPLMFTKILRVIEDVKPDAVLSIGDAIDLPQVSRWSKGNAGEYAPTLQKHISGFVSDVLRPLRAAAPEASVTWLEGNHDVRIQDFLKQYAYPLTTLHALSMESLFELDSLGIKYERGPLRVATNTLAIHGHEPGGYSAQPQAWDLKFLRRYGTDKNVLFGHTHQPFITSSAYGYAGKVKPRWVMNVGSIMNPEHAHYMKDGSVSWTQSFALLRDDGKRCFPELITANAGFFYVNGRRY